jgi:hypothetical protein
MRELAARKLPDVDALIAQAQAIFAWLLTATDCSCTTLDACDLFAPDKQYPPDHAEPLRITQVRRTAQLA